MSDEFKTLNTRAPSDPLVDRFGRLHQSLRLSVTDRCNLRCFYCMPEIGAQFAPRATLLTFEEIHQLTRLLASRCGVRSVRVTGGEPLVRKDLTKLIGMLASIDTLEDLSLTTNGILLDQFARPLRQAGLKRLNISIDTLDEETFAKISRRRGIERVIRGIDAAIDCGFEQIKLNTTAVKGVAESEIVSLVRFAVGRNVQIRFIEFMPLDTDRSWQSDDVLSGKTIREIIENAFGELTPVERPHSAQPASDFVLPEGGRVGIIQSVTEPFCRSCDRIRLTADGAIRNCLFAQSEFSVREMLRSGASDDELVQRFVQAVSEKAAGHGIDDRSFAPPDRPMYSIGG